jgi:purine-binding chemotaxis protein CheW
MEKQLVIFELGKEQFGIEIAAVEGIVKMQEITRIPYAPSYMEGITNLRGSVLPVIDLRKRFGLPEEEETRDTRIITVNMDNIKIGMIVSSVTEVLTIDDSVIEMPQGMMTNVNSQFITGVAKIENRLVILLSLADILSSDEKKSAAKIVEGKN